MGSPELTQPMKITDEPHGAIDRENAFLLFTTFAGDVVKTAHATGLQASTVLKMAEEEGWLTKLAPILALKKSTKPGDLERGLNRAMNFVQAHKMRTFISRVINRVTGMDEAEFNEYLFNVTKDKDGFLTKKLTTRALADLASALEKCQAMTYLALNDTSQDRAKRKEGDEDAEVSAADIHAQISEGLAKVRGSSTPRAMLFDAQLEQAQGIIEQANKPANPHDDDNH